MKKRNRAGTILIEDRCVRLPYTALMTMHPGPPLSPTATERLYDPSAVAQLFNDMAATYGIVNVISSFGFCIRWRRQCLDHIRWRRDLVVYDLMSGMGELWPGIVRRTGHSVHLHGVDISQEMCRRARANSRQARRSVVVHEMDVLQNGLPSESVDVIVSSFGVKTFSADQQRTLAREVRRLLKPGGQFAFLEISAPRRGVLRWPYMAYLRWCIPMLGRLFLGNPDCYRMLAVYTEAFGDIGGFAGALHAEGLIVATLNHFFGCATAVVGHRPA